MMAVSARRPPAALIDAAGVAAARLVSDYARRAARMTDDPVAYFLAGAAIADAIGIEPATWISQARAVGASWQDIADAMGKTKGNVHGRFRWVDKINEEQR